MLPNKHKILLIDDEREIRRFICAGMPEEEFQVVEASTGKEGLQHAATFNPTLILLDLGLPDIDGIAVLERIREWSKVPVIVLSARGDEESKIEALNKGADDYLTKPFSVLELKARIGANLRRNLDKDESAQSVTNFGGVEVDLNSRVVKKNNTEVHLTPIEFSLLAVLIRNAGKVVPHRLLLSEVWGAAYTGQNQYLRVFMANLRRKLEHDPAEPKHLLSEPGIGYRLVL